VPAGPIDEDGRDLTARIRALVGVAFSSPDALEVLAAASNLRAELERFERECVRQALEDGRSFAMVARTLGISRQAAHRRYRSLASADRRPLVGVPLTFAARATLGRAREEATRLGAERVDGLHVILALVADGHLPGIDLDAARAEAGEPQAGRRPPTSVGLPLEVAMRRFTPPVGIDDLLRAAYQEHAARDLLERLGCVRPHIQSARS
jgi:transposase-like protein